MESRCIESTAVENIVIGCVSRGIARSTSKTYCGTCARDLQSSWTSFACSTVGMSPVSRK